MAKTIRIKAQANAIGGRFCRAGRCFGAEFITLREDELTAEQLEAIKAEPMLWVEIVEEKNPTAKAEVKAKEESPKAGPEDKEPAATAPAAPGAKASASDAKPAAAPTADAKAADPKSEAKPAKEEGK